jgi:lipocalin
MYNLDQKSVKNIDITHFMGKWHEVARLCNENKKINLEAVTLDVSMNSKGIIHMSLTGHKYTPYGPVKRLKGKGKWNENKPGIIRNTFFLNFYRDYYILHVEEDYSVTIISNQTGSRLHILSRHPSLTSAEVTAIRNKILSLGYDPLDVCWLKTYF